MPFIPIADPMRVSPDQQVARDEVARQMVADELATVDRDNPEAQAALETEYEQRFHEPAPVKRGFIPLAEATPRRGFVPLAQEAEQASVMKNVALNNPLTAIGETALNLGSQMIGLPVAGLAGLATEAGHAMGLTDKTGAEVVQHIGEAMTYQPRGDLGQAAAGIVAYPFEKLAEAGQYAGTKTLEATDSPALATVVDTAIQAAPMVLGIRKKGFNPVDESAVVREAATDAIGSAASVGDAIEAFQTASASPLPFSQRGFTLPLLEKLAQQTPKPEVRGQLLAAIERRKQEMMPPIEEQYAPAFDVQADQPVRGLASGGPQSGAEILSMQAKPSRGFTPLEEPAKPQPMGPMDGMLTPEMVGTERRPIPEYADEKEKNPLATEAKPLERAQKNLSGINKDMQQVRRDNNLTPDEKRTRLDELTAEKNALLKATVTQSQQAQKEPQP